MTHTMYSINDGRNCFTCFQQQGYSSFKVIHHKNCRNVSSPEHYSVSDVTCVIHPASIRIEFVCPIEDKGYYRNTQLFPHVKRS